MTDIAELRRNAHRMPLHPESLLNVPLISQAFRDSAFRFIPRSVDVTWSYHRQSPVPVTGFNPFHLAFYYGQDAKFATWLADPFGSARDINEGDLLVKEVLLMVHDYLHAWAYAAIHRRCPALDLFAGPITTANFEDYVFCHLLSEAVATVGLDYWFLCERDVNQFCQIGSGVGPLTVHYREEDLPEYQRFCPDLAVQTPEFFRTIAGFYCTGEFPGFDVEDMKRSPRLLTWLRHELSYGAQQRSLTRTWLAYLAHVPVAGPGMAWEAPVAIDTELRRELIDELGLLLWDKVKARGSAPDHLVDEAPASAARRAAPPSKPPDFRFVNLARVPESEWTDGARSIPRESFKYFLSQLLGSIPFSSFPRRLLKHIPLLLSQGDATLAVDLLGGLPRREPLEDEPRDLMMVG